MKPATMNLWRCLGTYLLLGALISWNFPGLVQAQRLRIQESQTKLVKEVATGSSVSMVADATGFNAQLPVDMRAAEGNMMGTYGLFNKLSQPEPLIDATSYLQPPITWQPTTAQPQTSPGKRTAGLIVGLVGVGFMGAGLYLLITSRETRVNTSVGFPGIIERSTNKNRLYGGIALMGAGGVLSWLGFRLRR